MTDVTGYGSHRRPADDPATAPAPEDASTGASESTVPVPGAGAPEAVVPEPVVSEPVVSEPIVTEPVVAEPVVSDPVVAEPVQAPTVTAPLDPMQSWPPPSLWSNTAPLAPLPSAPPVEPPSRSGGRVVAIAVAAGLLAGLIGGVGGALVYDRSQSGSGGLLDGSADLGSGSPGVSTRPPESVAGIAAAVLPSVASIEVSSVAGGSTGSGFVIRSDGYLITNNHVIDAAVGGGRIVVSFDDGSSSPAEIVGRSPTSPS
jgi:putative serine protease PepD